MKAFSHQLTPNMAMRFVSMVSSSDWSFPRSVGGGGEREEAGAEGLGPPPSLNNHPTDFHHLSKSMIHSYSGKRTCVGHVFDLQVMTFLEVCSVRVFISEFTQSQCNSTWYRKLLLIWMQRHQNTSKFHIFTKTGYGSS